MKALTLLVALFATLSIAHADLKSEIQASNTKIAAAMKKKDFATLQKLIKGNTTADFKYSEAGRSESLDQMMGHMKEGLSMMKSMSVCDVKVLSVTEKANKATGMIRHTMVGTMVGPDKKQHKIQFTGVSENTFVKMGGKWKMSSMTWKSQSQTVDGKPAQSMGG